MYAANICLLHTWSDVDIAETYCTRWGRLWDHPHEQESALWAATEQAHFVFPHVLAACSVAGQPNRQYWKRRGQSCGINPAQATQVWDTEATVGQLDCVASSPSSACIAFLNLKPSLIRQQKRYSFWNRKLAQLLSLGVSLFCTQSRCLVLNLKVPLTKCIG